MAGGGHANDPAIHFARSATDDGDDRSAFYANPRLEHHGAGRLQRLHLYHHLDHRVSHDKLVSTEVQARIRTARNFRSRVQTVFGVQ